MSRILLLLIIVLWMSRSVAQVTPAETLSVAFQGPILFLGGFLVVVLTAGLWSRLIARTVHGYNLRRSLRRFTTSIVIARVMVPVWFGIGLFIFGWGSLVDWLLAPLLPCPLELPGMLVGTLPAFAAWAGLWWAQFPADRALREQNLLIQINDEVPIHPPPDLWNYFTANLRLQLLFTVVPVALILFLHDVATMSFWLAAGVDLNKSAPTGWIAGLEFIVQGLSIVLVLLFMPEVLRRVLDTRPLPGSVLRNRLEQLCVQTGLRYRDILLWRTNYNMGNAAVMGMIPQSRYILLSDVLLERMDQRQIEAVFAHEVGHVKHWHMAWYVVLFATLTLFSVALEQTFGGAMNRPDHDIFDALIQIGSLCGFLFVFGFLSRGFERQADVYAARTMQVVDSITPTLKDGPLNSHVGPQGADVFISALHRVAVVNNIPIEDQRLRGRGIMGILTGAFDWVIDWTNNYFHGSIATRMGYLRALSADPRRTALFDRRMMRVRMVLVAALVFSATWTLVLSTHLDMNQSAAIKTQQQSNEVRLTRRPSRSPGQAARESQASAALPAVAENAP